MTAAEDYEEYDLSVRSNLELYCRELVKIKPKGESTGPLSATVEEDPTSVLVPFVWNDAQRYVHSVIERQIETTGKARAIILKARQLGISTYVAARFYHKTTLNFGQQTYILTHEDSATRNLFTMVKRVHDNMIPDYRHELKSANANELDFLGMESGYRVGTAKNVEGVGRSMTMQNFHGSEVGFWRAAQEHMAGVMQTLPDARGTESILESTANGVGGEFWRQWNLAIRGESDYVAIFLPWFWEKAYRRPVAEGLEFSAEEIEYGQAHDLDEEQIAWLHFKNIELGGQPGELSGLFRQEYPATAEEAFQVSGVDSLITGIDVMAARHAELEDDPNAPLVLGVDTAEGGGDKTRIISRKGRRLGHHCNVELDIRDQMELADAIAVEIQEHKALMTFIDTTSGRGAYDRLVQMGFGHKVRAINFGSKAAQEERYANKRAEMWCRMRDWLRDPAGADMIDDDVLHQDMCAPGYRHDAKRRTILEPKEQLKKRLERQRSPDAGDAAALTFAETVTIPIAKDKSWMDEVTPKRAVNWMVR